MPRWRTSRECRPDEFFRAQFETAERRDLHVIDAHAGGDVGRVVLDGLGNLSARTVAERTHVLRQQATGCGDFYAIV